MTAKKLLSGVSSGATTIDEIFSIDNYKGDAANGAAYISNGINLTDHGGMVMTKMKSTSSSFGNTTIWGTGLGSNYLIAGSDNARVSDSSYTAYNSYPNTEELGFVLSGGNMQWNASDFEYTAFTFRKCPGFFDIVTYTGNGQNGRSINHNLGHVPGMIWVKQLDGTQPWTVYHKSGYNGGSTAYYQWFKLSDDAGVDEFSAPGGDYGGFEYDLVKWGGSNPDSSVFNVGASLQTNGNGFEYIAYLWADNPDYQAFGSYVGDVARQDEAGTGASPNGGQIYNYHNVNGQWPTLNGYWEPQFVMVKTQHTTGDWVVMNNINGEQAPTSTGNSGSANMRAFGINRNMGTDYTGYSKGMVLIPEGFTLDENCTNTNLRNGTNSKKHLWWTIRRSNQYNESFYADVKNGTQKVYDIASEAADVDVEPRFSMAFEPDLVLYQEYTNDSLLISRKLPELDQRTFDTTSTQLNSGYNEMHYTTFKFTDANDLGIPDPYPASGATFKPADQNLFGMGGGYTRNEGQNTGSNQYAHGFKRVPGIFDQRTYIGTPQAWAYWKHDLQAVPEMMWVKNTVVSGEPIVVYHKDIGNTQYMDLSTTGGAVSATLWNNTTPTDTMFSTGNGSSSNNYATNQPSYNHLWLGWASYPGISKVSSYSGNSDGSTTKFIECGFQPSFVLIKRYDTSGGGWCVTPESFASSGNKTVSFLNQLSNTYNEDWIEASSTGFTVKYDSSWNSQLDVLQPNNGSASYIFLAYV
tara:strand:+ start:27711 stop:29954 length:2244 start_codon:yes stop_codon:yes gene_type:complete